MKRPEWFITQLAVGTSVLLLIGGCSDTSAGQPNTTESAATSSKLHDKSSSPRTSHAENPFKGMVACDVFDKALDQMDERDFPDGEYDNSGGENGCRSTIPQDVSTGLTLQPGGTLEDFVDDPTKAYDGDIKGRRAVEERGEYDDGDCMLAMAVGPNDRAFISVSSGTMSPDEGCDLVEDIARKVEPLLPDDPS